MSSAVSSARKRRAGPIPPEPVRNMPASNMQAQAPPRAGLTLPEVIALVDKRLVTLEKFMNETKSEPPREPKIRFEVDGEQPQNEGPELSDDIIEEFNSRFLLLTEEMANIKDIIMKLQSYTMSVNKVLMEERIQIISNLGIEDGEQGEQGEDEDDDVVEENNLNSEVDKNGLTEFGIPLPENIPRIDPMTIMSSK
jgi:hypothetical protein